MPLLKSRMSTTPTAQKRWYQFLSLSLLLGLAAAIGALIFFSWLTDEVLEGDSRQFDEFTRAAVHELASPVMTKIMRGFSFVGSTLARNVASSSSTRPKTTPSDRLAIDTIRTEALEKGGKPT